MIAGEIRVARRADAEGILRIYSPAVRLTAASFEVDPPDIGSMRDRISAVLETYPWLVFDRDGEVAGYAYATSYRARAAYQWSVEVSVYVRKDFRRAGIARQLYAQLLDILREQGFFNAYAVITLPNPSSVALHEAIGFVPAGLFPKAGFKLGRWHDVGWWHLELQPYKDRPIPPVPFGDLCRR